MKCSYVLVKKNKQKELKSFAPHAYDLLFKNYYKFLDLSSCNLVVSRVEAIFVSLQTNLYHEKLGQWLSVPSVSGWHVEALISAVGWYACVADNMTWHSINSFVTFASHNSRAPTAPSLFIWELAVTS